MRLVRAFLWAMANLGVCVRYVEQIRSEVDAALVRQPYRGQETLDRATAIAARVRHLAILETGFELPVAVFTCYWDALRRPCLCLSWR